MSRRLAGTLALAALPAVAGAARAADLLADAARTEVAIEERVRLVLVHRMEDGAGALAADVADLARWDERLEAKGLPRTGLADDVRYLAAGLCTTRDAQRKALHDLLDEHPDPAVRRRAEHRLEADDAAAAERLLADDRHNRRATILNDAVRPLGIFSGAAFAAVLNPFLLAGSAADSLVTTAVNLWYYNRLSTPEREALARYQTLLEREPRTRDAPEITHQIRRLGSKRAAALCEETVRLGTHALDGDDLDHAAFYLEGAGRIEGCEEAAGPRERLVEARARRAAREEAAHWLVDDPPQPRSLEELRDYQALLAATALGDPGAMIAAAGRFRERHADSPFAPAALYAIAVARDLAGHREEGRRALGELAGAGGSAAARHAAAVLASPEYARLEALRDAERRHARDAVRYVLLGGRVNGRTALYGAAELGAEGLRAAQSFGIFNVLGVLTRAWQAWRRDPVSNQAIIDRGEEFLAREPHAPEAPEVHARLADAYERAGACERALMHYRATTDPSAERIARLERKSADHLLEAAERDGGDPALLAGIVHHFGATPAAEKARKRLQERPGDGETVLSRDVLRATPALLAPDALDLDPKLLDGERDNGELAEAGVTLAAGELRLTLDNVGEPGQHTETRALSAEAYARALAAAQEALYVRLLTADRGDQTSGRLERYIPFFVQGTVDEGGGVYVYPGVKMRRYRSEDRKLYE